MSIDVEDYFHVSVFDGIVPRSSWPDMESRVVRNTERLLDIFDEFEVRSTFFVLAWVAERHPDLVKKIAERGHEVASHGYAHRLVYDQTRSAFRDDVRRAKSILEDACGRSVTGYRAPSYSITPRSLWALDVLIEEGYQYDSSIFPIRHDVYGIPDAPRQPFLVTTSAGPIVEFPITTFRMVGEQNLPVGGGGYLRILPFWYTKLGYHRARAENLPLIAYIHPWEVDPDQPRIGGRRRSRLRHYTNLGKTHDRLRRLLALGRFSSFRGSGLADTARSVPFPPTVSTAQ
jgi:polysaccharide deacetylase family protein (PEP-CTERM system associated)